MWTLYMQWVYRNNFHYNKRSRFVAVKKLFLCFALVLNLKFKNNKFDINDRDHKVAIKTTIVIEIYPKL